MMARNKTVFEITIGEGEDYAGNYVPSRTYQSENGNPANDWLYEGKWKDTETYTTASGRCVTVREIQ